DWYGHERDLAEHGRASSGIDERRRPQEARSRPLRRKGRNRHRGLPKSLSQREAGRSVIADFERQNEFRYSGRAEGGARRAAGVFVPVLLPHAGPRRPAPRSSL